MAQARLARYDYYDYGSHVHALMRTLHPKPGVIPHCWHIGLGSIQFEGQLKIAWKLSSKLFGSKRLVWEVE